MPGADGHDSFALNIGQRFERVVSQIYKNPLELLCIQLRGRQHLGQDQTQFNTFEAFAKDITNS